MESKIIELLSNNPALPVLFVGSGLTRRYLGLPDWEGLLKMFCVKPYEYYNDKAKRKCKENEDMILPTTADYIEEDFNELWYTTKEYATSRLEHKFEMEGKISPLKICIADYFRKASDNILEGYEEEVSLLSRIGNKNISCIITTNYDCFIEKCFGDNQFRTYIGQDDLLFSVTYDVGELYKIHGCCTNSKSIVITSADYIKFAKKSAYLSSKILTMFLERPIIFLGYKVNDSNIMRILDSIADCLENHQLEQLSERLIFIERNKNPEVPDGISERKITTQSGKTISMKNIMLKNYSDLYKAILENKAKYDVKVLRRIKSQLYELVNDNKPTEKLYVATSIEDDTENIDFVVGVGVFGKFGKVGYRGIKSEELFLYYLGKSEFQYDDTMILKEAIPSVYKSRSCLPVCKFISNCLDKECLNTKVRLSMKPDFNDYLSEGEKSKVTTKGYFVMNCSIEEYYSMNGLSKTLSKIPLLEPQKIDTDDLLRFIKRAIDDEVTLFAIDGNGHQSRSQMKKCISLWDWLVYSSQAKENIQRLDSLPVQ
ncbi:MAG: SIR2 family protein [Phascolarctobacterium sp.]|nr:SIR2 family protein [Phascolarctobacterium sp.]